MGARSKGGKRVAKESKSDAVTENKKKKESRGRKQENVKKS